MSPNTAQISSDEENGDNDMAESITFSVLSGLEGSVNSNPKIYGSYPEYTGHNRKELLEKSLPTGAKPDTFYEGTFNGKKYIVYTFEIPNSQGGRPDLASIGFTLGPRTIPEDLKAVMVELIKRLKKDNSLDFSAIKGALPMIMDAINRESKVKIGKTVFDVGHFLKSQQRKLKRPKRKVKGGLV